MGKNFCKIGSKWCKYLRRGHCDFSHTSTESLAKFPRISQLETIQFADLLKTVEFENVFNRLLFYFPSQERSKQKYKEVFETLLNLKPSPMTNLNSVFIKVSYQKDFFDDKKYIDVEGFEEKVIRGGLLTIISNNYPPILFECWRAGQIAQDGTVFT